MTTTCPSCGARVSSEQSKCDLCGTVLSGANNSSSERDQRDAFRAEGGQKCSVCGSVNPKGSRFCNQCGSKIESVRSASDITDLPEGSRHREAEDDASEAREEEAAASTDQRMTRRILLTVGAGILVMVVLYGVTLFSEGQPQSSGEPSQAAVSSPESPQSSGNPAGSGPTSSTPEPATDPIPEEIAGEVESIEASIASADDSTERIGLQQKLVRLYVDAERQDLAGQLQEKIAGARETAMAWADAGNLYYDWMMDRQSRAQQTAYARKAIDAYRRSLEIDPSNLDVRTDMAVAYLYDPDNPMEAIRQTKKVLAEDPDHLQANFNRGIMLLRINRVDQAVQQFERVKQLAGAGSPIYERAEQVLKRVREQQQ